MFLITNETQELTVKNIADNILPDCDEVFFEVGYFYFSGFEQIYKKLNLKISLKRKMIVFYLIY